MASVTGSRLAFFAPGVDGSKVNVVLTPTGAGVPAASTVPGVFNIEVFTSAAGALASGYQASAFIQGAVQLTNNLIQAASLTSTEQLLAGNYTVVDQTGRQSIQIVGTAAGGSSTTVVGSLSDTITGSSVATNTQLIDASGTNSSAIAGPMTVIGGAGNTTVWAGAGTSVAGGVGAITVAGNAGSNQKITGGAGNLTAFNFGTNDLITGSTSGFTFIDDSYGSGGGNTIVGGAGNGPVTTPLGTTVAAGSFIIGGKGDQITGGSGTMLVNALGGNMTVNGGGGASTVWGAAGDSIAGGAGAMLIDAGTKVTVTGGSGSMFVIGGATDKITAGAGSTTVIAGTGNTVAGGAGSLQFNKGTSTTLTGGAGNVSATDLGKGDSIVGSSAGTTFIDDSYTSTTTGAFTGGTNTLVGGAGSSTIIAGPGDSVAAGAGQLEAIIRSNLTGAETVNLSASAFADGVRDVSVVGGVGAKVTVFGFDTAADKIESATSFVGGSFIGSAVAGPGGTTISFIDGSQMFLAGVANPAAIKFTA